MTQTDVPLLDVAAEKAAVRKRALAALGCEIVADERPACVSLFYPVKSEIDVLPLAHRLAALGVPLCLPVIVAKGEPLLFRRWRPGQPLDDRPFGLKEPLESALEVEPDLLFAPLAAFDRQGGRIGYGGGFYDRTLEKLRAKGAALAIGVAFAAQEVEAVPVATHDQRIDFVLTERGVLGR